MKQPNHDTAKQDADDLASRNVFADHEEAAREGGEFQSPSHHLDRVNLSGPPASRPSHFGAPRLDDEQLQRKVLVCNELLQAVADAIAQVHGFGSPVQDWIQQSIDCAPPAHAALFGGVQATPAGKLDATSIANNVRCRPLTEQRRLINDGLLDLMEGLLSRTADALPEDILDQLLIRTAGYRKRLGL